MGSQWGYDGSWPKVGEWKRLADAFKSESFPTERSKALFYAVCCVAGYETCLNGSKFGWKDVGRILGPELATNLMKAGHMHAVKNRVEGAKI